LVGQVKHGPYGIIGLTGNLHNSFFQQKTDNAYLLLRFYFV